MGQEELLLWKQRCLDVLLPIDVLLTAIHNPYVTYGEETREEMKSTWSLWARQCATRQKGQSRILIQTESCRNFYHVLENSQNTISPITAKAYKQEMSVFVQQQDHVAWSKPNPLFTIVIDIIVAGSESNAPALCCYKGILSLAAMANALALEENHDGASTWWCFTQSAHCSGRSLFSFSFV